MSEEFDTVICHYRVKAGNEDAFLKLLERHWPALRKLDLVTGEPSAIYRGRDSDGKPMFWEIFDWQPGAVEKAHDHPDVVAIWEPMDQLCERRGSNRNMEFPHVERVNVG